jgi:hypothetical protein
MNLNDIFQALGSLLPVLGQLIVIALGFSIAGRLLKMVLGEFDAPNMRASIREGLPPQPKSPYPQAPRMYARNRCEYCGQKVNDKMDHCAHCGASIS